MYTRYNGNSPEFRLAVAVIGYSILLYRLTDNYLRVSRRAAIGSAQSHFSPAAIDRYRSKTKNDI